MSDTIHKLSASRDVVAKTGRLLKKRVEAAQERFNQRVRAAGEIAAKGSKKKPPAPWELMASGGDYAVDFLQRTILFWDTMRQRGNESVDRARKGLPPVLAFDYEMELDGRKFDRAVNYALVRIVAPEGVTTDPKRRPYVIIDPRAGHGPGIGGFKDDSQVGVALDGGHPVYFVIFYPDPEPGQTLLDVCEAERQFVHRVRELHPQAAKPAIIGNCQGGWAAMMLAAANPDDTGPIVINGAPMSYWGGSWTEGASDNPMRYSGGLLGGTWLASLASDLGAGTFDAAWLVYNFENLNPANTFWDKYYHVFANVDTEPPRFLEFERWWGGFYLMNREEIEWITQNLFVGNELWSGTKSGSGGVFDLREIKVPIVLFASMGDNITPPQQAFNWIADVYSSTAEIKSRGQVIVGLVHADVGHLGIFVSGKVARKEHSQIVEVLRSIESLAPGLYAMDIKEEKGPGGKPAYTVSFTERRLEDIAEKLNKFDRSDEQAFESVKAVSEFNQRAYELFARPLVQAVSTEQRAKTARTMHPLRSQRWAISDLNPWTWWLEPAAKLVKENRKALPADDPARQVERGASELMSASLDHYRALRDAASEAAFFLIYGNMVSVRPDAAGKPDTTTPVDPRDLPFVKEALAAVAEGGYSEAVARASFLLARKGEPLPLERLQLKRDLVRDYRGLLPVARDEERRIRGEQEIVVRYAPAEALATLPLLLDERGDRERFVKLMERVLTDPRIQETGATSEQREMLARMCTVLSVKGAARKLKAKTAARSSAKPRPKAGAKQRPKASAKSAAKVRPKASGKSVAKVRPKASANAAAKVRPKASAKAGAKVRAKNASAKAGAKTGTKTGAKSRAKASAKAGVKSKPKRRAASK